MVKKLNCNAVGISNLSELRCNNLHDLKHADFASNCIVTAEEFEDASANCGAGMT